jgi:hypothetical protein
VGIMWQSITCGGLTNQHSIDFVGVILRPRLIVQRDRARARRHSREGAGAMFCKGACIIRDFGYYVVLECWTWLGRRLRRLVSTNNAGLRRPRSKKGQDNRSSWPSFYIEQKRPN